MKTKLYFILFIFLLFSNLFFAQSVVSNRVEAKKTLQKAITNLNELNCKASLENAQKVLKYALKNEDYSYSSKAYNVIGLNYEEFSDLKKALYYYNEGIKYALKENNIEQLDYLYNNIGNLYLFRLNNPKKGLEYYFKCYKYAVKHNDKLDIAFTELNIADAYFRLDNFELGKQYLNKILPVLKNEDDFEMYVTYYTLLGNYYSYKNDKLNTEACFKLVLERLSKNNTAFFKPNELEIYDEIYKFYKKNNDIKKALFFLEKHNNLQDELYLKERSQEIKFAGISIDVLEMNNKIQKIASEKKVQDEKMSASSNLVKMSLFFAGILLFFLIYMFKNYLDYRKLNKRLYEANAQLKIANIKSEEASLLKSQFLSNVSHELRTPLYGVIGMAEIIESEYEELKKNKYFNALKFSSNYLLSLINDVLNVYKIEDAKFQLIYDNVEIRKEIFVIRESLDVIAKSNKNELKIHIYDNVPQFIKTDLTRFSQILINLISNSLKFTKKGIVSISLQLIEENAIHKIQIQIEDNGIGIPEEYIDKIFEKFVQVDVNLNEQYKGTGLGLSIVQCLVDLFKGEIFVKSKLNLGTLFTVKLPYIEADNEAKSEKNNILESNNINNSIHKTHLKILIVEDNKINQMVTKKLLDKCNYGYEIAENGLQAIELIKKKKFDLILMDIHMPILNGFEASKKIRELGVFTPIIALTASDKNEIINEMVLSGINDILVKPFEIKDLQTIIEKHV